MRMILPMGDGRKRRKQVCYGRVTRLRVLLIIALMGAALFGGVRGLAHARLVDRILAAVNNELITLSDVQKYRALFDQDRNLDSTLEEIIDQKLLLDEARKFELPPPSTEQVEEAYDQLAEGFGGPAGLAGVLKRIIMTEEELLNLLHARLAVAGLLEQRINYFVFISNQEVEAYYQSHTEQFKGLPEQEARTLITDHLTQEKADARKKDYLERLRKRAKIQIN